MGAACAKPQLERPEWNSRFPVRIGCDRKVFVGTFGRGRRGSTKVSTLIHVPTAQGEAQFKHEFKLLSRLGAHTNLLSILHSEISDAGSYMALENVQCELQWLVHRYMFAKEGVPDQMARAMAVDLSHAIDHMHSREILHRDIKMESVLVTNTYDAKLVDMGTACRLGLKEERWIWGAKEYRAIEVCHGNRKLGPECDCWGIGVILHQMYQFRWDLVDSSDHVPHLRQGMPSIGKPMDEHLLQAMVGLLRVDTGRRWTTKCIRDRIAPHSFPGYRLEWVQPIDPDRVDDERIFLSRYRVTGPPVQAYALHIDSKAKHLFGKTVDEIGLGADDNILLLLADRCSTMERQQAPGDAEGHARRVKSPNTSTVLVEGSYLYFGLPCGVDTEVAIDKLERRLFPAMCKDKNTLRSIFVKPMTLNLEFDCFTFPDHVPECSIIGQSRELRQSQATQLSVRKRFGLNLAGIAKRGALQPTWFPGNLTEVGPGDLGLVLRCPRPDGRTEPTVTDKNLEPLMSRDEFESIMSVEPVYPEDSLVYDI